MKPRFLLVAAVVALVVPGVASASIHVPKGTVVDEIRAIGQNVRVDGKARGPVIVIGGNLDVGPSGQVANVMVIAGDIHAAPNARLTGDVFQFGGPLPVIEGWTLIAALAVLLAVRTLLIWLVTSAAALIARRPHLTAIAELTRGRPARTLLVGTLATIGLAAASVLLAITVIGLPFAAAIWCILLIGLAYGVALTLASFGQQQPQARRLLWIVLYIPILGDCVAALATLVGLGAVIRHLTLRPEHTATSLSRP